MEERYQQIIEIESRVEKESENNKNEDNQ